MMDQWIQTYSGVAFWPLNPRAEDVRIIDIAHALAHKCRYSGHCLKFYSVAEHSVHVSRHVSPRDALWGLMHDAAEAYLPDIPRPIKAHIAGFSDIERSVMSEVCTRFGMDPVEPSSVKWADTSILADEASQIMLEPPMPWKLPLPPLGVRVECWSPTDAALRFIERFDELTGGAFADH